MPLDFAAASLSPSGEAAETRPRLALTPTRSVAALILLSAVWRMWAGGAIHLTEDEAYYRLWAAHLNAGYYDHPPMIAWWIRAGVTTLGDRPLGVRLLSILGCGLSTWLVYDVARVSGAADRTACRAALWYNCTLLVGFGGLLATPDAPASLFWIATVWALARAGRAGGHVEAKAFWAAAGALGGLAVLSKYSALFLAPGVLLWLASSSHGRARLRSAAPWLALGLALMVAAPNLIWNAHHGWITIVKQFGRIRPEKLALQHLPEFVVVQAVLLNPLISWYGALGIVDVLRGRSSLADGGPLLVWVSAPFAAYLALHSLHASVQAHWPVPLYAGAAILAASAAAARGGARRWVPAGLIVSSLALVHLASPRTDVGRLDPALPLRGWPRFTAAAQTRAAALGAGWIGTMSYGTLAQLAAEGGRLPVLQIDERRRYDGLAAPAGLDAQRPGLVLDLARRVDPTDLARCFADVHEVEALERGANNGPVERYRAFLVDRPNVALVARGCITGKDLRAR